MDKLEQLHIEEAKLLQGDQHRREGIWTIFDLKLYEAESHASFDEYLKAKPGVVEAMQEIKWPAPLRKQIAQDLRDSGLSNVRIAQSMGVDSTTINKDLRSNRTADFSAVVEAGGEKSKEEAAWDTADFSAVVAVRGTGEKSPGSRPTGYYEPVARLARVLDQIDGLITESVQLVYQIPMEQRSD